MATRKTTRPTTQAAAAEAAPKATVTQPKGWSLHIGLNSVDPDHYGGWSGDLTACEFDALDMAELAKSQGIKPTLLLTRSGTRAKVLAALRKAAKTLKAGDLFLLSYSGHGGQVTDINADEPDGQDETWCLFDSQLIDDELYFELSRFAAGVRILVLSDSCHSGSVTRELPPPPPPPGQRVKLMPEAVAMRVYAANTRRSTTNCKPTSPRPPARPSPTPTPRWPRLARPRMRARWSAALTRR